MIEAGTVQIRIEVDLDDLGAEHRRLAVDLADAGRVAGMHHSALDRLDECGGNVHRSHIGCRDCPNELRRRPMLISSWRMRTSTGTFMAVTVGPVMVPVELRPWRA